MKRLQHLGDFESSNVRGAAYDPKTHELLVTFKGNDAYRYDAISPAIWEEFKSAPSKGQFVAHRLRQYHAGHKVK